MKDMKEDKMQRRQLSRERQLLDREAELMSQAIAMSPREDAAQQIADFVTIHGLINPFGGDVTKDSSGRFYTVLFSSPRTLDGVAKVYGPKFIMLSMRGPAVQGEQQRVYESVDDVLAYLKAAFVDLDQEAAESVPRKPRKP